MSVHWISESPEEKQSFYGVNDRQNRDRSKTADPSKIVALA